MHWTPNRYRTAADTPWLLPSICVGMSPFITLLLCVVHFERVTWWQIAAVRVNEKNYGICCVLLLFTPIAAAHYIGHALRQCAMIVARRRSLWVGESIGRILLWAYSPFDNSTHATAYAGCSKERANERIWNIQDWKMTDRIAGLEKNDRMRRKAVAARRLSLAPVFLF